MPTDNNTIEQQDKTMATGAAAVQTMHQYAAKDTCTGNTQYSQQGKYRFQQNVPIVYITHFITIFLLLIIPNHTGYIVSTFT
jgi:hypothetical protein